MTTKPNNSLQSRLETESGLRVAAEDELRLHNRAMDYSTNGIIITDNIAEDNPIIYANQAFLDMSGYTEEEVIGKNCRFLQGTDTDPEAIAKLREAVKTKNNITITLLNYRKDGTTFWNELSVNPVPDETGLITNFIGTQIDITKQKSNQLDLERKVEERTAKLQHTNDALKYENQRRKEIEIKLLEQQRQLEFSNYELEQFATVASHDLQEPLRMVSSYVRLIEHRFEDKLGQDGIDFIRFASEGADRMKTLINDLATYARLDRDSKAFVSVALNDVVEYAIADMKIMIEETNASISAGPLPTISGDASQLTQLFTNLLANALKYRSKKTPNISIRSIRHHDDHIIQVSDNGIGILPRDLERIFLVFRQVERESRKHGSGIGLALAKKIVVHHNGRIWAESEFGKSTTFNIFFPSSKGAI